MLGVLLGIALPPLVFGAFALLAMWLGAETRPWFDERPVRDDRPNWWSHPRGACRAIARGPARGRRAGRRAAASRRRRRPRALSRVPAAVDEGGDSPSGV